MTRKLLVNTSVPTFGKIDKSELIDYISNSKGPNLDCRISYCENHLCDYRNIIKLDIEKDCLNISNIIFENGYVYAMVESISEAGDRLLPLVRDIRATSIVTHAGVQGRVKINRLAADVINTLL